jgi:hypothetical protein
MAPSAQSGQSGQRPLAKSCRLCLRPILGRRRGFERPGSGVGVYRSDRVWARVGGRDSTGRLYLHPRAAGAGSEPVVVERRPFPTHPQRRYRFYAQRPLAGGACDRLRGRLRSRPPAPDGSRLSHRADLSVGHPHRRPFCRFVTIAGRAAPPVGIGRQTHVVSHHRRLAH